MLSSMTGYGSAHLSLKDRTITVEVRSVNHRYLDICIKAPHELAPLEEKIRSEVARRVSRGHVEVFISISDAAGAPAIVRVNKALARAYLDAFRDLSAFLGRDDADLAVDALMSIPGIVSIEPETIDTEILWPAVKECLAQAIEIMIEMRMSEGKRLQEDIIHRIDRIEQVIKRIAERAPEVIGAYRLRIQQRMAELVKDTPLDEARMAMEVALFAERSNVTEELVRSGSHLFELKKVLDLKEPVGRKMDFLLQELNREVNTIAAKSLDAPIAQLVVEVKAELEKMREQVQNIE
ncbi:MAG TPA: YicC family protein [Firmicutes bacterium]|nr:YicC family protein [Bacillota bacterium]